VPLNSPATDWAGLDRALSDLAASGSVEVGEDGEWLAELATLHFELRVERKNPLVHVWSDERNLTRRILRVKETAGDRIVLEVQRFGRAKPGRLEFLLTDSPRAAPSKTCAFSSRRAPASACVNASSRSPLPRARKSTKCASRTPRCKKSMPPTPETWKVGSSRATRSNPLCTPQAQQSPGFAPCCPPMPTPFNAASQPRQPKSP
jgi:hypothetical protein